MSEISLSISENGHAGASTINLRPSVPISYDNHTSKESSVRRSRATSNRISDLSRTDDPPDSVPTSPLERSPGTVPLFGCVDSP